MSASVPGGLEMAPSCLDKQTVSRELSYDWLVKDWAWISIRTFYGVHSSKQPELMLLEHTIFLIGALCHFVATHHRTLHPYRSACGIVYLVK